MTPTTHRPAWPTASLAAVAGAGGPTYPACLSRECRETFPDLGPYATFPGPATCPNCREAARPRRSRRGR